MSEIGPIRSEADYAPALAAVERLCCARSGMPEGDRLDIPATLIDAYESEHHPSDPPHRGDQIPDGATGAHRQGSVGNPRHSNPGRRGAEPAPGAFDQHDPPSAR